MKVSDKVKPLRYLADILGKLRQRENKVIVHCHGVFDLFHPGHLNHLELAKDLGDILIVTITPDKYVNKGPNRPVFNEKIRSTVLSALEIVDFVSINESRSAVPAITSLQPDVFVKGKEYQKLDDLSGFIRDEKNAIENIGGKMEFVSGEIFSSSNLLNQYFNIFSDGMSPYLSRLQGQVSFQGIVKLLEGIKNKKILVLGDNIFHEYFLCHSDAVISSDSSAINARLIKKEKKLAGAGAIANFISQYCSQVSFLAHSTGTKDCLLFSEDLLSDKVDLRSINSKNFSPNIEQFFHTSRTKLFHLSIRNNDKTDNFAKDQILDFLKTNSTEYDGILIADLGYGFVDLDIAEYLNTLQCFISVHTQTRPPSICANSARKYDNIDFICLNETEIRTDYQDSVTSLDILMENLSRDIHCPYISITLGAVGSKTWNQSTGVLESPALTTEVIDTIGAKEGFFSMASLCAMSGGGAELINFVGNVAGSMMVRSRGFGEDLIAENTYRFIETVLK